MKLALLPLVSTFCLVIPTLGATQPLECPQAAPVFAEAGAHSLDLSQLAQTVGTAELDGGSLPAVAAQIRADYPEAKDAEIADIMITAFCTYLKTDAPADHRSERASVRTPSL